MAELNLSREIVVRFQVEGFHRWPNATPARVYLSYRHRHLFHVEAAIEVFQDDREIEFHDFLEFCRNRFPTGDRGAMSCEHMAIDLINEITRDYPGRRVSVGVFEDGEVGARVTNTCTPPAARNPA